MPPVLRSAGVRLALSYAVVFGASALLLIFVLWISSVNILRHQVDDAIDADAQGLSEQWDEGGAAALLTTIQNRIRGNADNDSLYLCSIRSAAGWPETSRTGRRRWPRPARATRSSWSATARATWRASTATICRSATRC